MGPMPDQVRCPACSQMVSAQPELIGRVIGCPHCARHFMIPREGGTPVVVASTISTVPNVASAIRFTFTCQRCGSILEARAPQSGKHGRCPTCGAVFQIPQVDPRTGIPTGPAIVASDGQLPTPLHAYANAGEKAPRIIRTDGGESVIECPRCKRHMSIDANLCDSCGMPFTMEGAAAVVNFSANKGNRLATASLILGVVSLFAFCVPGLGLLAVILGALALRGPERPTAFAPGRRAAIAGIVCGLLASGWILAWFP
ncbi:MAG TPA: DUF4190 domain-containing protein [Phycisphaerae bacterium]|nr:DUF4190 domain-containing protein [Phycisphaerae bacterium]